MADFVTLTASRALGEPAKTFIAQITGVDRKYGFARDFLRAHEQSGGTRTTRVSAPGIYECRDAPRSGPESTFYVVLRYGDGLESVPVKESTVIEILKSGRPVTQLAPRPDGTMLSIRDAVSGDLLWKIDADAKVANARFIASLCNIADMDDHGDFLLAVILTSCARARSIIGPQASTYTLDDIAAALAEPRGESPLSQTGPQHNA